MKKRKSSLVSVLAIVILASTPFDKGPLIGHAVTPQAPAESSGSAGRFSGTWQWMFNGKSFATLILAQDESGFSGSLSGVHIELNDDGSLKVAEPSSDPSPSTLKKAWLEGSDFHIVLMDGDDPMEWVMTLKNDTRGEIRPISGEMANMKAIPIEKMR